MERCDPPGKKGNPCTVKLRGIVRENVSGGPDPDMRDTIPVNNLDCDKKCRSDHMDRL